LVVIMAARYERADLGSSGRARDRDGRQRAIALRASTYRRQALPPLPWTANAERIATMQVSRASFGAIAAWALTVAASGASVPLLVLSWSRPLHGDLFGGVGGLSFALLALAFATVGAIVAARVPGNAVGRIFLAIGVSTGVGLLVYAYATYGLAEGSRPFGVVAVAWLWNPVSQPTAPLLGLALLLFPDGRLPSRRWRAAGAIAWLSVIVLVVSSALQPGALGDPLGALSNPLGVPGTRGVMAAADAAGWVLAVAGMALGAAATLARLRRARGDERQQLKLVLTVGTIVAAATTLDMCTWFVWPDGGLRVRMAVIGVSFAAFAVATGFAILRYRLYDVDIIIDRTLVYGSLTVLLGAGYVVTTLVLATALGSGSAWATAGATLVVAVAFRPLRRALQDAVDRRFSRARFEALRQVAGFLEDLRIGRAEPEAIEPLLRDLLTDPMLELRFVLPESGLYVNTRGELAVDAADDPRVRTPIERAGTPLAVVLHHPTGPQRPDPLATLVEAGGLAIEIARLRVELRRHLAEVEASRARIVAAGHAERRRLERDLHDGAQQRLVSIGLELRHAQHELGASPSPVAASLERAVTGLSEAISELRALAQGLPPSQLDAGLEPALKELADRAPLPVRVRASSERFAVGVEATAYFIACEGLTNAIKHARATAVVLHAAQRNGSLVVTVTDDGVGGATPSRGSGLSGLRDRVAAHGGSLRIDSEPDAGTVLTAELPCVS
jgi:signal transduction histidine kinase